MTSHSLKKAEIELQRLRKLLEENQEQLRFAKETLDAIRYGDVDGIIRSTPKGDKLYILKGSDEPYRDLIEEMYEGAILLSEDNTILYSNVGFARLVNAPLETILGTSIRDWVASGCIDSLLKLVSQIREDAFRKRILELTFQTKEEEFVPTQISVNKLEIGSVNSIGIVVTNLSNHMEEDVKNYTATLEQEVNRRTKVEESLRSRTEQLEVTQKKLEESATRLQEYANQMEQLAQERLQKLRNAERLATIGQVAAMVGHDIRNPLQAIVSDIYLAESDLQTLPPSAERTDALESLREMQQNVEYINKIVQDLQDYSKTIKPVLKEVNLETLCKQVLSRNSIAQNIKTICAIENQVKVLMSDPDILMRILSNLVSNAVHAMPKGGKLTITASKESNDIMITVEDTGVGIPEEIKPKLFTPLFTTKSKGQGFGLAVVKRMTDAIGGTVTFETEPGKGTKFIVCFPPPQRIKDKWVFK